MTDLTFFSFRKLATMAGVEAIAFTAAPQQLIILRGKGVEITHSWTRDEDFADACTRALREFSRTLAGWTLRNRSEDARA
jgi:hypothetical protein